MSGFGVANLNAVSAWTNLGTFTISGTPTGGYGYSGAAVSSGGTEMEVASVPSYVVANVVLNNTTRNSYALVDSVTTGTAKLSQPQIVTALTYGAGTAISSPDNDWANTDSVTAYSRPNINVNYWAPQGSNTGIATILDSGLAPVTGTAAWIIGAAIPDIAGNNSSKFAATSLAPYWVCSLCQFGGGLDSNPLGRDNLFIQSNSVSSAQFNSGNSFFVSGILTAGGTTESGTLVLQSNVVLHGTLTMNSGLITTATGAGSLTTTGGVFADGTLTLTSGLLQVTGALWGSYAVNNIAATMQCTTNTFATNCGLTSGALKCNGSTSNVGSIYNANGTWDSGIALNPGQVDDAGAVFCNKTGARFTNFVN